MAAEVINLLIPGSGLHAGAAFDAQAEQKLLSRYLLVSLPLLRSSPCTFLLTEIPPCVNDLVLDLLNPPLALRPNLNRHPP